VDLKTIGRSKGERMNETEQLGGPMMVDQQRKPQHPIRAIVFDAFGTLCEIRGKRGPFSAQRPDHRADLCRGEGVVHNG
jgi:hypothetical protein